MSISRYAIILFVSLIFLNATALSQGEQPIEKSVIMETINGKEYYLHFVKKGETLFGIARAYGLTVDDVFRANPDSRDGINAETVLKLPVKDTPSKTAKETGQEQSADYFYHIVKKQETLYGIAKKYGITMEALKRLNPQMGEYPREGETLKIPYLKEEHPSAESDWEGETVTHTVEQGETLYGIAKNYDVTIGEIKNANPGLTDAIRTGTRIMIPNQGLAQEEEEEDQENENGGLIEHKVAPGETLYGIARDYAISIDTLKKYNPGLSAAIGPGQLILIPRNINEKGYIVHKPVKTERLDGISQKYNVGLEELEKMNPNVRKKAKKGQVIRIPVEEQIREEEPVIAEEETDSLADVEGCFNEAENISNTYNIALMLPLFLEEIDSIDFKEEKDFDKLAGLVSFRFVNFYAGFKMAVDSMIGEGMKLNLFVYDVDNDPVKADRALLSSELSSMDLIVGPFYLSSFRKVADFAETYDIPIINPLSKRDEIIHNNPTVFKVQPSEKKQIDLLVSFLEQKYPGSNIIVLRHYKYKYQSEVSYIRNSLNTSRPTSVYIQNERINKVLKGLEGRKSLITENKLIEPAMIADKLNDSTYFSNAVREVTYLDDSLTGLTMNLSRLRPNIVVALSDDIVFSKEILSQLNKLSLDHDVTLFGLPAWNDFSDLETSHLLNLKLHTFSEALIDFRSNGVNSWIKDYRRRYNTDPGRGNYAFDGFDVGWYFLNALYKFGRDFESCLPYHYVPLLQTRFNFEQEPDGGFQNTYWNLGIYDDYRYRKINFRMD